MSGCENSELYKYIENRETFHKGKNREKPLQNVDNYVKNVDYSQNEECNNGMKKIKKTENCGLEGGRNPKGASWGRHGVSERK